MGDKSWNEQDEPWTAACSADYSAPCAEDWALAVAGKRMANILLSKNHTQLVQGLQAKEPESPFGFATHVHRACAARVACEQTVLADPEDAFVGLTTSRWLLEVGLASDSLDGRNAVME